MRTLFSVASKLLGLLLIYAGLVYVISAVGFNHSSPGSMLAQLLSGTLAFVFAFVLTFRTDWLGQRVGVGAEELASVGGLDHETVLRTGIILIGIYVFVTRVAVVLSTVSSYLSGVRFGGIAEGPLRVLADAVPLVLAAYLVLRADRVVDWIEQVESPVV